jgi:FeS assembly SUF system regulator
MIKLTKLTDYAIVLMTYMARDRARSLYAARDLADAAQIPLPTVSKILKVLLQADLLVSHRGVRGGYSLARSPQEITVAEVITAVEGPIAVTECSAKEPGLCELEPHCPVTRNWRIISAVVRNALEKVTLADLTYPMNVVAAKATTLVPLMGSGSTQ